MAEHDAIAAADAFLTAAIKAVCAATGYTSNIIAGPDFQALIVAHMNAAASHARTQAISNLAEAVAEFCEAGDD